jgi:hypothetical protein
MNFRRRRKEAENEMKYRRRIGRNWVIPEFLPHRSTTFVCVCVCVCVCIQKDILSSNQVLTFNDTRI